MTQQGAFSASSFPVFLIDDGPERCYYGFPQFGPIPGMGVHECMHACMRGWDPVYLFHAWSCQMQGVSASQCILTQLPAKRQVRADAIGNGRMACAASPAICLPCLEAAARYGEGPRFEACARMLQAVWWS